MSRVEVIGNATLYLGDCREILPVLPKVDAVVTDPPYGVNGGSGTRGRASARTKYVGDWEDTPEYVASVIVPALALALSIAKRGLVTPGTRCCFMYPPPDDMGALWQPAATGLGKWGRATTQPVLFYGKDPRAGLTIQPKHFVNTQRSERNGHPCPKPLPVMLWAVNRASLEGETLLDPFMGSGTTGVAASVLSRSFIGIEIVPTYFDIACRQVEEAQRQARLTA